MQTLIFLVLGVSSFALSFFVLASPTHTPYPPLSQKQFSCNHQQNSHIELLLLSCLFWLQVVPFSFCAFFLWPELGLRGKAPFPKPRAPALSSFFGSLVFSIKLLDPHTPVVGEDHLLFILNVLRPLEGFRSFFLHFFQTSPLNSCSFLHFIPPVEISDTCDFTLDFTIGSSAILLGSLH